MVTTVQHITSDSPTIPHSLTAEAATIGCLIIDNSWLMQVTRIVSPEDFYSADMRLIYETILELFQQDCKKIDSVLLMNEFKHRSMWNDSMFETLNVTTESLTNAENCLHYAKAVRHLSDERRLICSAEQLAQLAHDQNISLDEKRRKLMTALAKLGSSHTVEQETNLRYSMDDIVSDIQTNPFGMSTGFNNLDLTLNGLQKGEFVLLAGRPSMGKSSLMLDMALRAWRGGKKILIFSMEMSKESIKERIVVNQAKVPLDSIRRDTMTDDEKESIAELINFFKDHDLFVNCRTGLCPSEIQAIARLTKAQYGLDAIFVDYLQLMRPDDRKNQNKTNEIGDISAGLMQLALSLEVPVVALSQLSRANEHREDRRPRLSDLRDSGSLEQDAHKVMFVHRDDYYYEREGKRELMNGLANIIVAKNRQGACGDIAVNWLPQYFTFEEQPI